jgi:hypothetical protein
MVTGSTSYANGTESAEARHQRGEIIRLDSKAATPAAIRSDLEDAHENDAATGMESSDQRSSVIIARRSVVVAHDWGF